MSTVQDFIQLGWADVVPDRPFTNLDYNAEDLTHLHFMADRLRQVLNQPEIILAQPRPYVIYFEESAGRRHRLALSKPEELLQPQDIVVVGFCGTKWPEASREPLDAVDQELLQEFIFHPHLLSYSSLQVDAENWRNLVLFSQPQGIGHWAISHKHATAVRYLAPGYYRYIRLHNGVWSGGPMANQPIRLTRTKYYDYGESPLWWAVRELS